MLNKDKRIAIVIERQYFVKSISWADEWNNVFFMLLKQMLWLLIGGLLTASSIMAGFL